MVKLILVSAPRGDLKSNVRPGSSFVIKEGGSLTIGRNRDNGVALFSSRVSKIHCKISMHGGEVEIEDCGSANGTFVNGVVTKHKTLKPGDKILVGDYAFELTRVKRKQKPVPLSLVPVAQSSIQGPGVGTPLVPHLASTHGIHSQGASQNFNQGPLEPQDFKGKFMAGFERQIMPFFYQLNFAKEWSGLVLTILVGLVMVSMVLSMSPLFSSAENAAINEVTKRAKLIASQIVEQNSAAIASRQENRTEIGSLGDDDGVRIALLTDLERRVIAPSSRANSSLTAGFEAKVAQAAAQEFKRGRERGLVYRSRELIVAIEPLKIYNPSQARNIVVAMSVVSIDSTLSTPSMTTMMFNYAERFLFTAVLAVIAFLMIYRLTFKPFDVLTEDMDRALKGEIKQVTQEFKMEEAAPLYSLINSLLQRIPSANSPSGSVNQSQGGSIEDFAPGILKLADTQGSATMICDSEKRILGLSQKFQEISGIRADFAIGQVIEIAARDEAFVALCTELYSKGSTDIVEDEFEFSGVTYSVRMTSFGGALSGLRGYLFWLSPAGEAQALAAGGYHG